MTRRKNEGTLFTCPAEHTPRQAGEPHNVVAVLRPLDVRGALHQQHVAHTVSIGRTPRCSRSHSARLALVLQPSAVLRSGRMCCSVVCLCTREQRQRRSVPVRTLAICNESVKATVAMNASEGRGSRTLDLSFAVLQVAANGVARATADDRPPERPLEPARPVDAQSRDRQEGRNRAGLARHSASTRNRSSSVVWK